MKIKIITFFLGCMLLRQTESVSAVNYEAYKTFLQGIFDLKDGHIDAEIKKYEEVIALDKNAFAIYKDLVYLYWQLGNAEKLLFSVANLTRDPLIYDHLGDTYVALGKINEAWIAYALSYDFKQDKNVKKKLNLTQVKISQEELYKQMLLRSESNYLRMSAFKTGFKVKLNSSFLSKSIYVLFSYTAKYNSIKIGFSTVLVPGGASISIKNGQAEISPKAVEKEIPQVLADVILQICKIFNGSFYKQFADAKVIRNGKRLTYYKDGIDLTINMDTALIENFSQQNINVKILKYDNLFISKIPSKIKFNFSDLKIKGALEATKISFINESTFVEKNENTSKSTSKN
ncbi:MAG: hypothetical protein LBT18_05035 [Endomicrobium sp.]|jgi:tetratricopeptide (TPR) repeat protein|nr:hypothetical protein [Endomicrobium sp.]